MQQNIVHPFPPVYGTNSEILILGTMPSPKSRERNFFYMHNQNRFWRVMEKIFGWRLEYRNDGTPAAENSAAPGKMDFDAAIKERKALILANRLALWDVLSGCDIEGAADSSIKNALPNDFTDLLAGASVRKVLCTGKTAFALYEKLCAAQTGMHAVCLPSTSSANAAFSFEKLCREYAAAMEVSFAD